METAFCKFSFATSLARLAYSCRLHVCTAYHLQAIQAQLLCWGNTTRLTAGWCWHRPIGKIQFPSCGKQQSRWEAAITTSPWNPVPCPVQPRSVTELHSSGKAGILLPQHFQLHVLLQLLETTVLAIKWEEVITGLRGTRTHSSSVPTMGVILHCASNIMEVRPAALPPLAMQKLSLWGTLGTNTGGKSFSEPHG